MHVRPLSGAQVFARGCSGAPKAVRLLLQSHKIIIVPVVAALRRLARDAAARSRPRRLRCGLAIKTLGPVEKKVPLHVLCDNEHFLAAPPAGARASGPR